MKGESRGVLLLSDCLLFIHYDPLVLFAVQRVSSDLGLMVIRCPHESHRLVLSSLSQMNKLGSVAVTPVVLRVAATPRSAYKFLKVSELKVCGLVLV